MSETDERRRPNAALWIGLCLIALVFLLLTQHGCWMGGFPWFHWPFGDGRAPLWVFAPFGFVGAWLLLQLCLAVWVGVDAGRRGQSGLLWGLLVFFTSVVGLIVYLIAVPMLERNGGSGAAAPRTPRPAEQANCEQCGTPLRPDFKLCPNCGTETRRRCDCGRELQRDWKVCPYCGRSTAG